MIYSFKQVDRATGKILGLIGYDFPNPDNNHPMIQLVPIRTQEEYAAAIAELESSAKDEEDDTNENGS